MTPGPNIISSQKQKPVPRGDSVIKDGIHNLAVMNPTPTREFETWFLDLQIKQANSFCSEECQEFSVKTVTGLSTLSCIHFF